MRRHTLLCACLRAGFCLVLLLSAQTSFGQTVKTIALNYEDEDFDYDMYGCGVMVDYKDNNITYSMDLTAPALPYIHYYVLIDENLSFQSISIEAAYVLVKENVDIVANQLPVLAGEQSSIPTFQEVKYSQASYPSEAQKVLYTGTHYMGSHKVISFCVCPLRYEPQSRKLYLSKTTIVNIQLKGGQSASVMNVTSKKNTVRRSDGETDRFVSNLVLNPEDMVLPDESAQVVAGVMSASQTEMIDYLVITNSDLADAFAPLIKWKQMKGLRSKVVTTSEIYSLYPNSSMSNPLKIKSYLKDYYDNHGLQYVLLGGDDTIVPVQYCSMTVAYSGDGINISSSSDDIPTDMYYGCFSGSLDWDANHNGVYGEYDEDDISLQQDIALTRLPVRSATDVTSYVNRLISYESDPLAHGWNNSILTAGSKFHSDTTMVNGKTYSDSNYWGDRLFGNWPGERKRFYDTDTDFTGGENYELHVPNLQSQFSTGYGFFDMMCHGLEICWQLEIGTFRQEDAKEMVSPSPMFISTSACLTNAFDSSGSFDPCLSECFFRNPNSGVLGYFGCSRETFASNSPKYLRYVLLFMQRYYEQLFQTSEDHPSHLGNSRFAKSGLSSFCAESKLYLWMMYGFNQMGDPEVPVYTSTPKQFEGIKISYTNGTLSVEQSKRNFFISAISASDNGASYYENSQVNGWSYSFDNITDSVYVCLQADGYVPFVFKFDNGTIYLQECDLKGVCSVTGSNVVIGEEFFPYSSDAEVKIDGNTTIKANQGTLVDKNFEVPIGSTLKITSGGQ